jgi:hypothetical protein
MILLQMEKMLEEMIGLLEQINALVSEQVDYATLASEERNFDRKTQLLSVAILTQNELMCVLDDLDEVRIAMAKEMNNSGIDFSKSKIGAKLRDIVAMATELLLDQDANSMEEKLLLASVTLNRAKRFQREILELEEPQEDEKLTKVQEQWVRVGEALGIDIEMR